MHLLHSKFILLLFISMAFASMPAVIEAADNSKPKFTIASNEKERVISKGQAIAAVKSELKGKVLSATRIVSKGPPVYKVKVLLAKGRIRTVYVDGISGRVIRIN